MNAVTDSRSSDGAGSAAVPAQDFRALGSIDRDSPVPYYYQLQEILKQAIEGQRWRPGDLLPSEAELAEAFGISRTVIRQALDVLEGDGQIYKVKGKGSVVAPPKFRYEAVAAAKSWLSQDVDDSVSEVRLSKLIHLSSVSVGGHVGQLLKVATTDELWEAAFVSAVEDKPVSLSQIYLRRDASPGLQDLAERGEALALVEGGPDAIHQLAERYDVRIAQSEVTIESTAANDFEAKELLIPVSTPVFLLSLLATAPNETPVAFIRTIVRSDHFHFAVVIRHRDSWDERAQADFVSVT